MDAFVQELKYDLDIPGFEEDLLQAMVMEAEEATQAPAVVRSRYYADDVFQ